MGDFIKGTLGFETESEKRLRRQSTAQFGNFLNQRFLPPSLREDQTGGFLQSGVQQIGDLIRNPGGLSSTVSSAIAPRLATESEGIARDFRGIRQNQTGAAARSNLPVSIKASLESALDVAQSRAQRGARRAALSESEELRRSDLNKTFAILDSILQFMSSGKGQAIQGLGTGAQIAQQRNAATQRFIGSLLSLGLSGGGKE
jgi:hypothetical protein